MGHRHRATTADLLAEQWHNRARGTEHVTEAHDAEAGLGFDLREALQNQLREALGGAHHVRGTYRFVGRDQHKGIYTRPMRGPSRAPRAVNIIGHAFRDVVLHHRHVFVCRRVINRINRESAENRFETLLITHATQQGHHRETQALPLAQTLDLTIHAVERKL